MVIFEWPDYSVGVEGENTIEEEITSGGGCPVPYAAHIELKWRHNQLVVRLFINRYLEMPARCCLMA